MRKLSLTTMNTATQFSRCGREMTRTELPSNLRGVSDAMNKQEKSTRFGCNP